MEKFQSISPASSSRNFLIPALIFIIILRLVCIGTFGLMPQDAYYYFYGEHLALSYFDHPPMIAYMLRLFTGLFGKFPFVIKLADSFITALSFYFFHRLSVRFLEQQNVSKSAVLFLSTFMFTILSLISTPDVPMILFWILCLLYLQKALFLDKKVHWISAGFFMGLAFDSKYTALLLPGGLGLFLLISNNYRHYLFSKYFLGMLAVFSATISPVIIWNFQNNFASFKFQSQGRMESMHGTKIDISNFSGFIGHQSAVLMPILFFALFYFPIREWKKFHQSKMSLDQQQLFLLSFFVPGFIAFFLLSIIYWVKLNWTMPAYLTGIIWVSRYFSHKWLRLQVLFSFLVHVALAIEIFFYPFPINSDDTWIGWKELAKQVRSRQNENPGCFVFSADDYKTSAMLHFYLNENVYGQNILGKPALQFDYVGTDLNLLSGQNALFINSDPDFMDNKDDVQPVELNQVFEQVESLNPILIERNNKIVRKFSVLKCIHYRPEFIARMQK